MRNISPSPNLETKLFSPTPINSALFYPPDVERLIKNDTHISIVSNSYLLHEALMLLLKGHQWIQNVNRYTGDADIFLSNINVLPDLVLIDSGIGRELTLLRIQQWRSLNPSPYIIVLELKKDTEFILDCIEVGAHAYALQSASSTEITKIIEQVYQGSFQCSAEITAKLFDRLSQPKSDQRIKEKPPLTRRELEVLHYVAKEYSDREIATQLVVEVRTVKHHVHNILQKLNVRHRWDAAQIALKNCWLELPPS